MEASDPSTSFVPPEFEPPVRLENPSFVLEPLGPQHAERDHAAWTSSIPEIRALPGFETTPEVALSLESTQTSLELHARDFAERKGFAYTVLDPGDEDVIGCVYIYPQEEGVWLRRQHWQGTVTSGPCARVRAWVRADRQELLDPLNEAVGAWLRDWPFEHVQYIGRPDLSR
jgi:hypothetical protein